MSARSEKWADEARRVRAVADMMEADHPESHPRHKMWVAMADLMRHDVDRGGLLEGIASPEAVKVAAAYMEAR